jgi:hypothetical protein
LGALFGGKIYPIGILAIVGSVSLLSMRIMGRRYGIKTDFVWFGRGERLLFIFLGVLSPLLVINTGFFVIAGFLGFISSIQIILVLTIKWYKARRH